MCGSECVERVGKVWVVWTASWPLTDWRKLPVATVLDHLAFGYPLHFKFNR